MIFNNINVGLDYGASVGAVDDPEYDFFYAGGSVNLAINRDFHILYHILDAESTDIGGCTVQFPAERLRNDSSTTCGRIKFDGCTVETLLVGGQELLWDGVIDPTQEVIPPTHPPTPSPTQAPTVPGKSKTLDFDDLPGDMVLHPDEGFDLEDYATTAHIVEHPTETGDIEEATVDDSGKACGEGQELKLQYVLLMLEIGEEIAENSLSMRIGLDLEEEESSQILVELDGYLVEVQVEAIGGDEVSVSISEETMVTMEWHEIDNGTHHFCGKLKVKENVSLFGIGGKLLWLDEVHYDPN